MTQQRFYVTRYWQTKGIEIVYGELNPCLTPYGGKTHALASPAEIPHYPGDTDYYYGNDYWCTKEEAIAHVEKAREKLIESAKKKISKLKALVIADLIKDKTKAI